MDSIEQIDNEIARLKAKRKELMKQKFQELNKEFNIKKFTKSVGENIRKRREEKGLSQSLLGKYVGLSRSSIVNIEQGNQNPGIERVFMISNVLEIDVYKLFKNTYNPKE